VPGSEAAKGLAMWIARDLAEMGNIQSKKKTTQDLSNHLVFYLYGVRSLETDNWSLDRKTQEHLDEKVSGHRLGHSLRPLRS
jgi:hypothetical protein